MMLPEPDHTGTRFSPRLSRATIWTVAWARSSTLGATEETARGAASGSGVPVAGDGELQARAASVSASSGAPSRTHAAGRGGRLIPISPAVLPTHNQTRVGSNYSDIGGCRSRNRWSGGEPGT